MKKGYVEKTLTEDEESRIRKNGRTKPRYFSKAYVTVTAASKMLSHAHFGEPREVMGLLQGKHRVIKVPTTRKAATASLSSLMSSSCLWSPPRPE